MAQLILRLDDGEEVVLNTHVRDEVIESLRERPMLRQAFGAIDDDPARGFWTSRDGHSNGSPLMDEMTGVVYRLISGGCGSILSEGWRRGTAGLIIAQLAHIHGMAPLMSVNRERAERR